MGHAMTAPKSRIHFFGWCKEFGRPTKAAIACCLLSPIIANAVTYDISWTGTNNYSMTGTFSFADSLINTGPIDGTAVQALRIQGFKNGSLIGRWDLADGYVGQFNFNFNSSTGQFILYGATYSLTGQNWNISDIPAPPFFGCPNPGIGFFHGDGFEALCVNNQVQGAVFYPRGGPGSALTATLRRVPEPGTLALLSLGLLGLGCTARRRLH